MSALLERIIAFLFQRFCAACHLRSASVPHHDECPHASTITNGRHFRPTFKVTTRELKKRPDIAPPVSIARARSKR